MLSLSFERLFLVFNLRFHLLFADMCLSVNGYLWKSLFKNFFEYKALTVNRYFVALFTAYFARAGFSQDFWNESGRTEKPFTTPWITDIRRSRSVTRKLVSVPGVGGSSKWCIHEYRTLKIPTFFPRFCRFRRAAAAL